MVTTVLLVVAVVLMIAVVGYLVGVLIKSIRNGLQVQGSTLPEGSREQIMKVADRLLTLVTRDLKKEVREGLKG